MTAGVPEMEYGGKMGKGGSEPFLLSDTFLNEEKARV